MRLMRWLGAGFGWALSVALVAWVSWAAINSAGRQVAVRTVISATSDGGTIVGSTSPTVGPTSATGSPAPSGRPGEGSGPLSVAQDGSAQPGESGSGDRSPGPGPSAPATSPPAPLPPAQPGPVAGTVNTVAGSMWVECVGVSITSAYAFPAEGWSGDPVRVVKGRAETTFRRNLDIVGVSAVCDGGRPRFEVQSHEGHDDGGHDDAHHD